MPYFFLGTLFLYVGFVFADDMDSGVAKELAKGTRWPDVVEKCTKKSSKENQYYVSIKRLLTLRRVKLVIF